MAVRADDWRDWAGLPANVLAKVAEKLTMDSIFHTYIPYSILRVHSTKWTEIQSQMKWYKRHGLPLFVLARVCKEWRKAQLEVGARLLTRVRQDVIRPGRVALAKWALAEGCPRDDGDEQNPWTTAHSMAHVAAEFGHLELVQWLCGEGGFAMDELVMYCAAGSGNLELVRWLRGEGCPWNEWTCFNAVHSRHVEVLRWARENGCPWRAEDRDKAAAKLGYTDDLGSPVDDWTEEELGYTDEFDNDVVAVNDFANIGDVYDGSW